MSLVRFAVAAAAAVIFMNAKVSADYSSQGTGNCSPQNWIAEYSGYGGIGGDPLPNCLQGDPWHIYGYVSAEWWCYWIDGGDFVTNDGADSNGLPLCSC